MRRRRLAQLLLVAATMLFAMMMIAGPAAAADDTEEGHGEEATGFGTNTGDAVIVAAVAGILMGGFAYSQSEPGGIERVTDEHH